MQRAYLTRMPAGFPGDVSRKSQSLVESGMMAETVEYGTPVKMDTEGKFALCDAVDDAVYGFMVRPYPTQAENCGKNTIQDCMRSGYMTVKLAQGTASKGMPVSVRVAAKTGKNVGDIEAVAPAVAKIDEGGSQTPATDPETFEIPGCIFMGEADSAGNVEISFNV